MARGFARVGLALLFGAKKNGESVLSPFSEPVVIFLIIFIFLICMII